ncbi:hypothetical protein CPHO_00485 [Corynebacterium phocae]|uniref:DNA methylase adenine-specific domain-containing protein n=1 Tax=Corynebacterium phocae TaxID=161895 RepID=A0A1L7D0H8_9CORY|nr:N-6 DNA methylase [Corynebacterium phocae]APT91656.1 hypothetical protein CPHO_00485 [Corynebacterium phocae]KAA8728629.1 N-6 DNA methylase [Corynebacterium phocae]
MTTYQGQLALKDIAEFAGVSRPTVSNWRARNEDFPQPTQDSTPRRPFFDFSEVLDWLEKQDLLPEDWKDKAAYMAVRSAINPLMAFRLDPVESSILCLGLLAAIKRGYNGLAAAGGSGSAEMLKALKAAFDSLKDSRLLFIEPGKVLEPAESLSPEVVRTLIGGLAPVEEDSLPQAAVTVLETFLGKSGRSAFGSLSTDSSTVTQFLANAASTTVGKDDVIYDPTCGTGSALLSLQKIAPEATFYGNDLDAPTATIAALHAYLRGANATITQDDAFEAFTAPEEAVDTLLCEPPLGEKVGKDTFAALTIPLDLPSSSLMPRSEIAILVSAIDKLSANGRAYVLVPTQALTVKPFAEFRQRLVARGVVEAVIQLPPKFLTYTSVGMSLWVLRSLESPETTQSVAIADATDADAPADHIASWLQGLRKGEDIGIPSGIIDLGTLVTNGGDLLPARFLQAQDKGELVEQYVTSLDELDRSIQQLKDQVGHYSRSKNQIPTSKTTVTVRQLIQDGELRLLRHLHLYDRDGTIEAKTVGSNPDRDRKETVAIASAEDALVPGDIIVPDFVEAPVWVFDREGTWAPSRGMFALRVQGDKYRAEYLAECISAEYNSVDDGSRLPRRSTSQLRIPVLTLEEQDALVDWFKELRQLDQTAKGLSQAIDAAANGALNVVRFFGSN